MGYEYEIKTTSTFKSVKTADEIQELAERRGISNFRFLLIHVENIDNETVYTIDVETQISYGKYPFLGEIKLVLLIKDVSHKSSYFRIFMAGESGENWGYAVQNDCINEIEMRMVEVSEDVTDKLKNEIGG